MTQEEVIQALSLIEHPAIRHSLIKLGIVTDIKLVKKKISLTFAFPFAYVPIADFLIQSIAEPIKQMGLAFEYTTRVMNNQERNLFLQLEMEAWKVHK